MASSFLKNFSMNFTATVPPPKWQAPGKRVTNFRTATRMPERKKHCALGGCLRSYTESMRVYFQAAYDNCAARRWTVPLPRIQNDTGVFVGAGLCGRSSYERVVGWITGGHGGPPLQIVQ